jgi:hypothetical protein
MGLPRLARSIALGAVQNTQHQEDEHDEQVGTEQTKEGACPFGERALSRT